MLGESWGSEGVEDGKVPQVGGDPLKVKAGDGWMEELPNKEAVDKGEV